MNKYLLTGLLLIVLCVAAALFWSTNASAPANNNLNTTKTAAATISPATTTTSPLPNSPASNSNQTSTPPATPADVNKVKEDIVKPLFSTPLKINGVVLDQSGNKVAQAHIDAGIIVNQSGINKLLSLESDNEGRFALETKGFGASLKASKDGYKQVPESTVHLTYNDQVNNVVLKLKKAEPGQSLIHASFEVSLDRHGGKYSVNILKDVPNNHDSAVLDFQSWIDMQGAVPTTFASYPWHAKISVPGGGLVQSSHIDDTKVPQGGYQPELAVEGSSSPKWSDRATSTVVVQFPNHKYALINTKFIVGRNQTVHVDAYYNPSGSTDLDVDSIEIH